MTLVTFQTNAMEHSPHSDANNCSTSQQSLPFPPPKWYHHETNVKETEHTHCIHTSSDTTHECERFWKSALHSYIFTQHTWMWKFLNTYNAYKHLQSACMDMKVPEHNGSKQSTNWIRFEISCESTFNLLFPFQNTLDLHTSLKYDSLLHSTCYASRRIKLFTVIYGQRCGQWSGKKIIKQHPLTHVTVMWRQKSSFFIVSSKCSVKQFKIQSRWSSKHSYVLLKTNIQISLFKALLCKTVHRY